MLEKENEIQLIGDYFYKLLTWSKLRTANCQPSCFYHVNYIVLWKHFHWASSCLNGSLLCLITELLPYNFTCSQKINNNHQLILAFLHHRYCKPCHNIVIHKNLTVIWILGQNSTLSCGIGILVDSCFWTNRMGLFSNFCWLQ